jgi:two-component system, cell cycle response regulator
MEVYDFNIVSCSTGVEALAITRRNSFNLICIAYHLPDFSGEILCQQLRGNPLLKNTRIILFTAEDNAELLNGALLAGATDIYNKNDFAKFQTYIERFANLVNQNLVGNVLLVEDSSSQQHWIKAQLESAGLSVEAFYSAEEALEAFNHNQFDIVVTDMVLAGKMSGLNLVRTIRRLSSDKSLIPIFAITAHDEVSRRIELFQVGACDYMTKPLNPEEMLYRISNLIKARQAYNELASERKLLHEIAMLDPVTNLYNRNALNQLLPKTIANAKRDHIPISLAVMDIDLFKNINDTHGHPHGDRVLAEVGAWLRSSFREGDLIFRWGGEEFVILLNNCALDEAAVIIEKQRKRFAERRFANCEITASFGISSYQDFSQDIAYETWFEQSDQALYQAKTSGRNKVVCAGRVSLTDKTVPH